MDTDDARNVEGHWAEYRRAANREARERLIVYYAPLVKYAAARVSYGLPPNVERADLIGYGMFGLIDAIDKFDADRHVKFETYALIRIKGAIIDELRAIDWIPRSVRTKGRAVDKAYAKLEALLLRSPNDFEVAAEMGISPQDLHGLYAEISSVSLLALDGVLASRGEDLESWLSLADTIADGDQGPVAAFEVEEMKQILAEVINRLSDREKFVLALYYYEGMTFNEVGEALGITESRVCQIHGKAIVKLRTRLRV